jgi:hypothetical protein
MIRLKIGFSVLIILAVLGSGCARTVVERPQRGDNIQITALFRGAINPEKYAYYVIASNDEAPLLPYVGDYLPFPGLRYNESLVDAVSVGEGITYYYSLYFSSWSDYLVYEGLDYFLYNSGDKFGASTDVNSHFDYTDKINFNPTVQTSGKVFKISFASSELSNMTDYIYLMLVVCDQTTGEILDKADEVLIIENEISSKSDTELAEEAVAESADFLSWEVQIY